MFEVAPPQRGPHVWTASDHADPAMWTWALDADTIQLLCDATDRFAGRDVDDVAAELWSWHPGVQPLEAELIDLRETLMRGRGFTLVTGLPVAELSTGQAAAIFVLLGGGLGSLRSQNAAGDLLGHVRNVGLDSADPNVRIYQTDERQTFHTDSTDAVGLLCLRDAESGGESLLVSAAAIWNRMLDEDEELAATLFHAVATDRRGEIPPGGDPWFVIPVLSWFDQALTVLYQRQYIESAQRFEAAPQLSTRHRRALDRFDAIANEPDMFLRMRLEPGDMQFVYNHALLHDRTSFSDRPGAPRHLLRLWLSLPGDRQLPASFEQRYGSIEVGDRGGIVVG